MISRASSPPAPHAEPTEPAASGKGRDRGGRGRVGGAGAGIAGGFRRTPAFGTGAAGADAPAVGERRAAPGAPVADPTSDKRRKTWDSVAQHPKLRRSFNGKLATLKESFVTTIKRLGDMEESIWQRSSRPRRTPLGTERGNFRP